MVFTAYVRKPDTRDMAPVDCPLVAPDPDEFGRTLVHLTTAMAVAYEQAGYAIWRPTCHNTPECCPDARQARAHGLCHHGPQSWPPTAVLRLAPTRTW